MKKILLLAAAFSIVLGLASCSGDDSIDNQIAIYNATHQRKENVYPLYNQGAPIGDIALCFLDGVADLPYIEAGDMVKLLSASLGMADKPISVTKNGFVVTCVRRNAVYKVDTTMTIDFDKDIIRFDDYNLFLMKPSLSTILDVSSLDFFDKQGRPRLIKKMESKYLSRFGEPLEINLAKYGIDLVVRDGKYLLPLQTFSDIFVAPTFLSCLYFNGKAVILADDMSKESGRPACKELYYQGSKGERSEALAKFGYGELCMALDLLLRPKGTAWNRKL